MAAAAQSDLSIAELKAEIERLGRELDQASSEKIQSAQLGLVLLEEKGSLQQRCDELESLYENTKHELEITQEVSALHSAHFTLHALMGTLKRAETGILNRLYTIHIMHYFPKAISVNY